MKLRTHLLVLIAGTLLPMLAFAAIASALFVQYQRATVERGARERTLALVTAVDAELRGAITALEALASSGSLDIGDLRAFHETAARVLQSQPDWLTINLALPSGQQVVNVRWPVGARLPMIQERSSFDRVLQTRRPVVRNLVANPTTQQFDYGVRVPVVRGDATTYVLSAVISSRAIAKLLAAQRLPPDWVGVVLDVNDRIIARTVAPEQTVGQPASESLRAALARAPEGWFRGSIIEGAAVYTPYNKSTFSGWTVAMGIPAAAVEAPIRQTVGALAIGVLAALAVAGLLGLLLARRIARPVAALAARAEAIGLGERPEVPGSAGIDEIGDLGRALDEAATAVRARAETQGRLAAIVESSGDAMISYSLDGLIQTWNPAAGRLFGYAASEVLGRHVSLLVPPDRVEEIAQILAAVGRGEARAFDTERLRSDGTRIPVALSVSPIRAASGAVTGLSAVGRDITERHRAEARLREGERRLRDNEERLRLALTGAGQGTWDWDLRTRTLIWDARCKAIAGLPPDFPVTYEWHVAALHADDRDRVVQAALVAMRERTELSEEYRTIWPDGSLRWVLAKGRAYYDDEGEAVRMAGTVLDITDRKQAEEALRAADRAKDEFLAMLGHELRNPLGAIAGAVGVLDAVGRLDERAERARLVIGRQVKHVSRLVDDLLDVSRLSKGKVVLDRQPLDLAALVSGVMTAWQTSGRLEGYQVSVDATPVWVDADEARMEQVLANLAGNALKYTPTGGRIVVQVGPDGETAVLEVRDTGAGIPASLLDRLFEPFVQGDRALDRSQGGLGLGLALVKRLVETHGGTVHARSQGPGKGSVFTVRLPRVPPAVHRVHPGPTPSPQTTGERWRILVIEDNEDAREMLRVALSLSGHEVHEAADGASGVDRAAAVLPDVALIDVGLPGIDGYEVACRIRAGKGGGSIRLIAITGYGQAEDKRRALDGGFDTHLTKPVTPERLQEAITRLMAR